jgi:hypothetical protein
VTINSKTTGMVQFSGGSTPFKVWLNGSAPGCSPNPQPFVTSNYSNSWQCTPNAAGTYNVHLDAIDSTGYKGSASASLTVQSSGGGVTPNGTATNPLAGLDTVLPTLFIFAFVFLGAIVALAAGVITMAVLLSRRLRQLTEAMKVDRDGQKSPDEAPDPKPPS